MKFAYTVCGLLLVGSILGSGNAMALTHDEVGKCLDSNKELNALAEQTEKLAKSTLSDEATKALDSELQVVLFRAKSCAELTPLLMAKFGALRDALRPIKASNDDLQECAQKSGIEKEIEAANAAASQILNSSEKLSGPGPTIGSCVNMLAIARLYIKSLNEETQAAQGAMDAFLGAGTAK